MRPPKGKNLPAATKALTEGDTGSPLSMGELLSKIPEGTPPEEIQRIIQTAYYTGPVPPPSMLGEFEHNLPGSADRILKMAEKEQDHRHSENRWLLFNDTARIFGAIVIPALLIAAAVYCGVIGQPWLGGVLGTSGVIAGIAGKLVERFKRT